MEIKKTIGKNIANKRNELELTQEDLSAISNVAKITISKIERGDTSPKADTLWKLSQSLNTSIDYFFTGVGDSKNAKEEKLVSIYNSLPQNLQSQLVEYALFLLRIKNDIVRK